MSDTIVTPQPQLHTLATPEQQIVLADNTQVQVLSTGVEFIDESATATIVTKTGSSYTLTGTDSGTILRFTSNAAITLTCPNNLSAGFQVGIVQAGMGQITPTAAMGATMTNAHSNTKTFGQWAECSLMVDANTSGTAAHYIFGGDTA